MLNDIAFKTFIDSAPLISIDIILKKGGNALLGMSVNKPPQGYFFSTSDRINKNKTIDNAMARVALNELNIELKFIPKFIDVFENFYDDSF